MQDENTFFNLKNAQNFISLCPIPLARPLLLLKPSPQHQSPWPSPLHQSPWPRHRRALPTRKPRCLGTAVT